MGKSWIAVLLVLSGLLFLGSQCNQVLVVCEDGDEQECFCPDGTISNQFCRADSSGWETCDCTTYSIWCDEDTDLCWQDPQKDAYDLEDPGLIQHDALKYCDELVMGSYDDWRLPDIDELRTVISGNPPAEAGGECPITEGSPRDDMANEACRPIEPCDGPGEGNCYWIPEFTGTCCDKPDPASVGHPLEFVSSTVSSDLENWVGCVLFDNGAVSFNHIRSYADVRCVRTGPKKPARCGGGLALCEPGETRQCTDSYGKTGAQTCADNGFCFGLCESTEFTISPPIPDICDECDQIELTIRVPEKLTVKPAQIMAFLYEIDDTVEWTFPPMRPPDGGTFDNQVLKPDIDVDKPYTMPVSACTYYRENCVSGEFYLVVLLINEDKNPPFPVEGEYAWGMIQEPITLGDGPKEIIEKEVTLVPCGEDTDNNSIGDACES